MDATNLYETLKKIQEAKGYYFADDAEHVMGLLEALLVTIPHELAKGNVVELGDFGNFWLKHRADGCDIAGEVSAGQIITLVPRFNPGKEFRKVLQEIEFEKA